MRKPEATSKNRISGSHLFLMEMILALLLFAVAAAASVSVFVKAHQMSEEATALTEADADLASVSEFIRSCRNYEEIEESLGAALPGAVLEADGSSGSVLTAGFRGGGSPCAPSDADYTVTAVWSVTNMVLHADLACADAGGTEIASFSIDHVLTEA